MVADILGEPGMRAALAGKLLLSLCAGVSAEALQTALYGDVSTLDPRSNGRCRMVRVMPNTAAGIRQSMTVIATSTPPLEDDIMHLVRFLFGCIGEVVVLPPSLMDASTALCGSGPAFFLLLLEAAIDGGVAMGLPRAAATKMAAQTMKGACMTVLEGTHPAVLKDKVTTPGGCTMGGLMVLEEGGVRGTVAKAVRVATVVASKLGEGAKNVNGPSA
jgi:pyrroline-5-carboxylate reductase